MAPWTRDTPERDWRNATAHMAIQRRHADSFRVSSPDRPESGLPPSVGERWCRGRSECDDRNGGPAREMSPMLRMAHGSEHPKVRFRATRSPVQVSEVPGGRGRLAPSSAVPADHRDRPSASAAITAFSVAASTALVMRIRTPAATRSRLTRCCWPARLDQAYAGVRDSSLVRSPFLGLGASIGSGWNDRRHRIGNGAKHHIAASLRRRRRPRQRALYQPNNK